MDLRIVTSLEEFAALRPAWDRLFERCAQRSPFTSHAWFDAAWQWRSQSADLLVICCESGGDLVGAMPLVRERGLLPGDRKRALSFLTVPDTQRCDVLAAQGLEEPVVEVIAAELPRLRANWDVLRLRHLTADSITVKSLAPALMRKGIRVNVRPVATNPHIALDRPWDAYYSSRSRRLKKASNLAANRLAKAGHVEVRWLAPGEGDRAEVDRTVNEIVRISSRSWKTRTGNSLDQTGPQAFIRRLSYHAHEHGWLSIWRLSLDGIPVAMEYQLCGDGNIYALRSDFDADYEALSPGSYLSRLMIESYFGRGLRQYSMGPGENAYKYRWADSTDPVLALSAYAGSVRGNVLAAWELGLKPLAQRLRDRLRRAPNPGSGDDHDAR